MSFFPWPDIDGFHNVRKTTHKYPELFGDFTHPSVISYRAKVKLHGTNAAVQCHADGTVVAQSRSGVITPENDNAGFARWVAERADKWSSFSNVIFFGEFIGPGIQKGTACNLIPSKSFVIFACAPMDRPEELWCVPSEINSLLPQGIPNVYVLPWHPGGFSIDWSKSSEELAPAVEYINKQVELVEACDPWVKETFGVEGIGEGLVFYPTFEYEGSRKHFSNFGFKAKGEAHRVVKSPKAATVDPEVASSIEAFVDLAVTEARLEQGATTVNADDGFDKKRIGNFVRWVLGDVAKETQDELEASGLTMEQVSKAVSNKASRWYISKS